MANVQFQFFWARLIGWAQMVKKVCLLALGYSTVHQTLDIPRFFTKFLCTTLFPSICPVFLGCPCPTIQPWLPSANRPTSSNQSHTWKTARRQWRQKGKCHPTHKFSARCCFVLDTSVFCTADSLPNALVVLFLLRQYIIYSVQFETTVLACSEFCCSSLLF